MIIHMVEGGSGAGQIKEGGIVIGFGIARVG